MLFPILGPSSLPVVVAQPDEKHGNRTASVLEEYDDTDHSTTTSSNEEEAFTEKTWYARALSNIREKEKPVDTLKFDKFLIRSKQGRRQKNFPGGRGATEKILKKSKKDRKLALLCLYLLYLYHIWKSIEGHDLAASLPTPTEAIWN